MVLGSPGGAELVIVCFVWVRSGWEATRLEFPWRNSVSHQQRLETTGDGNVHFHEILQQEGRLR